MGSACPHRRPQRLQKAGAFLGLHILAFARQEQADEMRLYRDRHREVAAKLEARTRPCPVGFRYREAAIAKYPNLLTKAV